MKYKVNDLVYFDIGFRKGVGKIVAINGRNAPYLVHSTSITDGANGTPYVEKQDNDSNIWVDEVDLKPFVKKVGQKYKVIRDENNFFEAGGIIRLAAMHPRSKCSLYENSMGSNCMYDLDSPKCEVEFYADVEEHKENKMFTKDDLKVGYLVKVRDGRFAHVVNTSKNGMCLNYERSWDRLDHYGNDLTNNLIDLKLGVVEVYGFTIQGFNAHKFEVGNRKLLWKREEVKEMTIEDIQKALGHKIKVVE